MTTAAISHVRDGVATDLGTFELEPPLPQGEVPERVLQELVYARTTAKDYAQSSFSDAVKAQAEKHGVNASALKRYIVARESDKLEEAAEEADDLAKLIGA